MDWTKMDLKWLSDSRIRRRSEKSDANRTRSISIGQLENKAIIPSDLHNFRFNEILDKIKLIET